MKAKIEKHGNFDYRWTVSNFRGYSFTRFGAIRSAKKQAKSIHRWQEAKKNVEIVEL